MLGDLGDDIIKVEPPGDDEARYYGVTQEDLEKLDMSPSFITLNRNKRSVEINMRLDEGKALARRIALSAAEIGSLENKGVLGKPKGQAA